MIPRRFLAMAIVGLALFPQARTADTLDQLRSRAASADKGHQPELYSELALKEADAADQAYNTSADTARKLLEESVTAAEKAADAAVETGKRLKRTEIDLRKVSERLESIRRSWAFDDRGPVTAGIQKVEAARSKLLDRMFRK
jgi:uncharacterized tellurite resistance protein B-like protein